jgi:fumarylacetoacetase
MRSSSTSMTPFSIAETKSPRGLSIGDSVILRAWGEREGFVRIGLGECRGTVLPARVV